MTGETNGAGRKSFEPALEIHDDYVMLGTTRLERANVGWKEGVKDWHVMWEFLRKRLRAMGDYNDAMRRDRAIKRDTFRHLAGIDVDDE